MVLWEGSKFCGSLPVIEFESVNDKNCINLIRSANFDVIVVFGTRRLGGLYFGCPKQPFQSAWGNPEMYRGLDSHLWAIYHGDLNNLVTTLHYVDSGLDTGDIVVQNNITITQDLRLHEIRAKNTEICVQLTRLAVAECQNDLTPPSRKQQKIGRYYSAMPSCLKEVCLEKFDNREIHSS